ncbi:MAG TPA: 3-methyl-2-oxobutanoate dehydrogenase subunit beta, partial [Clostridia bacterium]|nr:3-methyl-2-oxobutanoate dehydrogenase subunit beta [Clostridia bacterium]
VACKQNVKAVVAVEMSLGQMVDDVRIAVNGAKSVGFLGTAGGVIPTPADVAATALKQLGR